MKRLFTALICAVAPVVATSQTSPVLHLVEGEVRSVRGSSGVILSETSALLYATSEQANALRRQGLRVNNTADAAARPGKRDLRIAADVLARSRAGTLYRGIEAVLSEERTHSDFLEEPDFDEAEYHRALRARGLDPVGLEGRGLLARASASEAVTGNSDRMIGTVSVSLFFIERDGSVDSDEFSWTDQAQDEIFNRTVRDLLWWSERAAELGHALSFELHPYYADHPASRQPYEPIRYPSSRDSLFINEALAGLGFDEGRKHERILAFNTWQREEHGTDASFVAFYPYNPTDQGAPYSFTDGYGGYAGSEYTVILYSWMPERRMVLAHETGHIFRAPDEYSAPGYGGCVAGAYTTPSGVPNGNCEAAHVHSVSCMMKSDTPDFCAYTPAHVGWTDDAYEVVVQTEPTGVLVRVLEDTDEYQWAPLAGPSPISIPYGPGRPFTATVEMEQPVGGTNVRFNEWDDGSRFPSRSTFTTGGPQTLLASFTRHGSVEQTWRAHLRPNQPVPITVDGGGFNDEGDLWVVASNALSRFDGEKWRREASMPVPSGANSHTVKVGVGTGVLWVAQRVFGDNVGLSRLLRYDGSWTIVASDETNPYVSDLSVGDDGTAWVIADGRVLRADETGWSEVAKPQDVQGQWAEQVHVDAGGDVWVSFRDWMGRYSPHSSTGGEWVDVERVDSDWPTASVDEFHIDSQRRLWIAATYPEPIIALRDRDGAWTTFDESHLDIPEGRYFGLSDFAHDAQGNLWMATSNGVYSANEREIVRHDHTSGGEGSRWVSFVSVAPDGNPVAGLSNVGVSRLTHGGWLSLVVLAEVQRVDELAASVDYVSLASFTDLLQFDGLSWDLSFPGVSAFDSRPGIYDIAVSPNGETWATTRDGIYVISDDQWSLKGPAGWRGQSISISDDGVVWVGGGGDNASKILRVDEAGWSVIDGPPTDQPWWISAVAVAPDGAVWVETQGGAARWDGSEWTMYTGNAGYLLDLEVSSDGRVWAAGYFYGPSQGAPVAWLDGNTWHPVVVGDGQEFVRVSGLSASAGALWLGSAEGIYKVENSVPRRADGPDVNVEDIDVGPDGTVWYLDRSGVLYEHREGGVRERNRPPRLTSYPPNEASAGQPFNYTIRATDPDGDGLSFSIIAAPDWLSISSTGTLSGLPPTVPALYAVEAVVEDGRGGRATQPFTLQVTDAQLTNSEDSEDGATGPYVGRARPNPLRERSLVTFGLSQPAEVEAVVYDILRPPRRRSLGRNKVDGRAHV